MGVGVVMGGSKGGDGGGGGGGVGGGVGAMRSVCLAQARVGWESRSPADSPSLRFRRRTPFYAAAWGWRSAALRQPTSPDGSVASLSWVWVGLVCSCGRAWGWVRVWVWAAGVCGWGWRGAFTCVLWVGGVGIWRGGVERGF